MYRITRQLLILILAGLLASACSTQPPPPPSELNLLVAVEGTARLKREGWKDFVPVAAGTLLASTDLLDVQGSASVLCAGPQVLTLTALGKTPCPTERTALVYEGARFSSGQRGAPADVPYLLFPRNTLVLDARPQLIWHDSGAPPYTVSISDDVGTTIWEQADVAGTTLVYPDDAPALAPGLGYLLVVRDANGRSSAEDPEKGLGFGVINAETRAEVLAQRAALERLEGLDEPAHVLAVAVRYATWPEEGGRGLHGEAWLLFNQLAQTHDTPALQLWLGNVLAKTRLTDEATAAYQRARDQASAMGDTSSQAAAEAGLWRVNGDQAHLDAALALYDELGDRSEAAALRATASPTP